jgi:prepilin-type processing-associated H-X9-DG protein
VYYPSMKALISTWPYPSPPTVMPVDDVCKVELITDGTSNTAVWVEAAGKGFSYFGGITDGNLFCDGGAWAITENSLTIEGSTPGATTQATAKVGATDGSATCAINCTNQSNVYSFHPGGAMMLFADGSVHIVSNNLTFLQLGAMVTRSYGEVINPTWFN